MEERHTSLINWDTVTMPKANGGLGIRKMRQCNVAFLSKVAWRLMNESNSLWAQVLIHKYRRDDFSIQGLVPRRNSSIVWKGIVKSEPILAKGIRSRVRNGQSTFFWLDRWFLDQPLISLALSDIPLMDQTKWVADFWVKREGWNWMALDHMLPVEVKLYLSAFILIEKDDVVDGMYWAFSKSRIFTVKFTYESQFQLMENNDTGLWKKIWQLDIPQRARAFLWLTSHEKFMYNLQRARRGFLANPKCPLCL